MKVLHVLAPAPAGGLESVVRMLAAAQRAGGEDARVIAVLDPSPQRHPFLAALEGAGVPAERLEVPHRRYWREYRGLVARFRETAPAVVHTHGYRADVLAGLAARRASAPLVSTAHGFIGGDRLGRLYEWLQVRGYRNGRQVVAVSRPMLERLRGAGVPEERSHLIRNAWREGAPPLPRDEARARLGLGPHDAYVVGWVGRVGFEKGPDVVLEAMARPEADGALLSVIGEGDRREREERRARELGISDRVRWHGSVEDAARIMRAFDVLALTSRTEGTPIVLFEAMAAGIPIVATAVGGVPDVLRHDQEGLLVAPEDPPAVAAALVRLRADPALAARLATAADRRLREEFGPARWVERYAAVYELAIRDSRIRKGETES